MIDLSVLKDNSILISPFKKEILSCLNKTDLSIKILSKNDLINNLSFDYDDKAIIYLMKKGYSYSNAKELISCLHFIKDGNEKLNKLYNLKQELLDNNLIKNNSLFSYLLKDKQIYIYGYSSFDKEILLLLNDYKNNICYINDETNKKEYLVNEYLTIEEEVDSLFNEIGKLVKQGVPLNKIKLLQYPGEYDLLIKKYASFYKMPINFKSEVTLDKSPYFKIFKEKYINSSLEEVYKDMTNVISVDNYRFLDALKGLIYDVDGLFETKEETIDYLSLKALDIHLSEIKYQNGLDIISYNHLEDDHIFIIGFNLLSYPKVIKDVTYLNDKEKEFLNINTSLDNNKIEEDRIVNFLNTHNNLHISYKKKIGKSEYYPSVLINKLEMKVVKKTFDLERTKKGPSVYLVAKANDKFDSLGVKELAYKAIDSKDVEYKNYNHKYKHIAQLENDKGILNISYSQVNYYSQCPFMYFVEKILKLGDFEGNFNTKLGEYYHSILEKSLIEEIDFDKVYQEIGTLFSEPSDIYFARKSIANLNKVISDFNDMKNNVELEVYGEKKCKVYIDPFTVLNGTIDKVVYIKDNNEYFIVDYKTGNVHFDEKEMEYGLSLQLPTYLILSEMILRDREPIGIFIQNIIPKDDKEISLEGLQNENAKSWVELDSSLRTPNAKSKYFGSLKTNKEGNVISSKNNATKEEFDQIKNLALEKIEQACGNIRKANFEISPIKSRTNMNIDACKYCSHQSICFKNYYDNRYVDLKKENEE